MARSWHLCCGIASATVAITGRGNDDSRVAPTFALVDHYLKKPIDPDALGTSVAIALGSHLLPPPSNGLGGESRGVVIDAHTHPALVLTEVVHAVRDGFAEIGFKKVMDLDLLGLTLGLPLTPAAFEGAYELLLLRVHRDHGLAALLEPLHAQVDTRTGHCDPGATRLQASCDCSAGCSPIR